MKLNEFGFLYEADKRILGVQFSHIKWVSSATQDFNRWNGRGCQSHIQQFSLKITPNQLRIFLYQCYGERLSIHELANQAGYFNINSTLHKFE